MSVFVRAGADRNGRTQIESMSRSPLSGWLCVQPCRSASGRRYADVSVATAFVADLLDNGRLLRGRAFWTAAADRSGGFTTTFPWGAVTFLWVRSPDGDGPQPASVAVFPVQLTVKDPWREAVIHCQATNHTQWVPASVVAAVAAHTDPGPAIVTAPPVEADSWYRTDLAGYVPASLARWPQVWDVLQLLLRSQMAHPVMPGTSVMPLAVLSWHLLHAVTARIAEVPVLRAEPWIDAQIDWLLDLVLPVVDRLVAAPRPDMPLVVLRREWWLHSAQPDFVYSPTLARYRRPLFVSAGFDVIAEAARYATDSALRGVEELQPQRSDGQHVPPEPPGWREAAAFDAAHLTGQSEHHHRTAPSTPWEPARTNTSDLPLDQERPVPPAVLLDEAIALRISTDKDFEAAVMDPLVVIIRPLIEDVREPATAAFYAARERVEELAPLATLPEAGAARVKDFHRAVEEMAEAWTAADANALSVGMTRMSTRTKSALGKVKAAVARALDERTPAGERAVCIRIIGELLDNLDEVPPKAREHTLRQLETHQQRMIDSQN